MKSNYSVIATIKFSKKDIDIIDKKITILNLLYKLDFYKKTFEGKKWPLQRQLQIPNFLLGRNIAHNQVGS